MLNKIKKFFSKEDDGNKKFVFIVVVAVIVIGWVVLNNITQEKVKVSGNPVTNEETGTIQTEIAKREAKEAIKKEVQEEGIFFEDTTQEEENTKDKAKETYSYDNPDNEKIRQLENQIKQLKQQLQQMQEEKKREENLNRWAVSQIGKPFEYGKSLSESQSRAVVGSPVVQKTSYKEQTGVYELTGVVLDEVRLPVGWSKYVRIQTDKGLFVVKARATPVGIVFSTNGIKQSGTERQNVYVQVEDLEGNTNLFSYVIDVKGQKVKKAAFLAFIKGFAEGMVDQTVQSTYTGTVNRYIEGGFKTGLSKGVEEGVDVLVEIEKDKIKELVDKFVLLKGEKVRLLVIEGGIK